MTRKIDLVVVHCSDSPNGKSLFSGKDTNSGAEGGYETDVKAANPVKAITKVIKYLGLNQMPADPFLITVAPRRKAAK